MPTAFNIPDWIEDRQGNRYRLEVNGNEMVGPIVVVCSGQELVGRLCLIHQYPVLRIADLMVRDDVIHPLPSKLLRLLFLWIPISPKTVSLRGRGLGTALIKIAKNYAVGNGFEAVDGKLSADDLIRTPHLRDFYRKGGFEIVREGEQEKIWLSLR